MTAYTLGIDLGGTNTSLVVCDAQDHIRWEASFPTDPGAGFAPVVERLIAGVAPALASFHVAAVGVAAAAQLDPVNGIILASPNLGFTNAPLGPSLRSAFKVPIIIENDVNAAAKGESVAQRDAAQPLLAVFVGTGVGAGLIVDGRVFRGATGVAAEIGHVPVVAAGGERCGCGRRGCMEAYAGGRNLLRRAQERRRLPGKPFESVAEVAAAAGAGDTGCSAVLEEAAEALGMALTAAVALVNPATLVWGGGVARAYPPLIEAAISFLQQRGLPAALRVLDIRSSALGARAAAVGAAILARAGTAEP